MIYKGFTLDKFQEDSINAIENNNSVVVSAPTGSGKTLIADYIIEREIENDKRVIYTAPIKALSNQKYQDFCELYGKDNVGLVTGDTVINSNATIVVMTTEIYRNMVLIQDESVKDVSYVIFDEIHYINDMDRGYVWEESIIFSPDHVRLICLSATIPNAKEFASWIEKIKNHQVITIIHIKRPVPLEINFYDEEIGVASLKEIHEIASIPSYDKVFIGNRRGHRRSRTPLPNHLHLLEEIGEEKFPCMFFCFSRMLCKRHALELEKEKTQWKSDSKITQFIIEKLKQSSSEINTLESMRVLKKTLPKGIGFHHAGLLPIQKEIVEELFAIGKIKVLYVTETFAVGINMPAKTVCFDKLKKFDGINILYLSSKEFFQMAGRAGRRGKDDIGYVYSMIDRRGFDYYKINSFTSVDKEPLKSQFKLSINTVLNLINQHSQKEITIILKQSFYAFQTNNSAEIIRAYENIKKKLIKNKYIKDMILTEKGEFASKLFVNEIEYTEIFHSDYWKQFDDYSILLIIAAMTLETSDRTEFYNLHFETNEKKIIKLLGRIIPKQINNIPKVTALIFPLFKGQTFFELAKNTSLEEGNIIRFFNQIIDRINQLQRANEDPSLKAILDRIFVLVKSVLIGLVMEV